MNKSNDTKVAKTEEKQEDNGKFNLDEDLTADINNNVTDKTIANIIDHIQVGPDQNNQNTGDWKQSYTDWLSQQATDSDYYIFDLNKDGIPEIAVSSVTAAYGIKLASYNNGSIQETQVAGTFVLYTEADDTIDVSGENRGKY